MTYIFTYSVAFSFSAGGVLAYSAFRCRYRFNHRDGSWCEDIVNIVTHRDVRKHVGLLITCGVETCASDSFAKLRYIGANEMKFRSDLTNKYGICIRNFAR